MLGNDLMPQETCFPKRLAIPSSSRQKARRNFPIYQGGKKSTCPKCGKMHTRECKLGARTSFRCAKADHYVKDYPMTSTRGNRPLGGNNK